MSHLKYISKRINNRNSNKNTPTKLFLGGIHGNESKYISKPLKSVLPEYYFGNNLIYVFDPSTYISTLKKEFWESENGKSIIRFIKKYKPDFYIELHSYNIKNYKKLVNHARRDSQGVPPLIELENKVLISSVSPLIRTNYFDSNTVCITLELPVTSNGNNNENYSKNIDLGIISNAMATYIEIIKIIAISKDRQDLEKRIMELYPVQRQIAIKYAEEVFNFKTPF